VLSSCFPPRTILAPFVLVGWRDCIGAEVNRHKNKQEVLRDYTQISGL
jgi:hypothetical protein